MALLRLLCVAALLSFAEILVAAQPSSCVTNTQFPYRLPQSVLPSHYSLYFNVSDPTSGALSYVGAVDINVVVTVSTTCVVLDSYLLNFTANAVNYQSSNGAQSLTATKVAFDSQKHQVVIYFSSPLVVGPGTLYISSFQGIINSNDATGFFISDNSFQPSPLDGMQLRSMVSKWQNKRARKASPGFHSLVEKILSTNTNSNTAYDAKEPKRMPKPFGAGLKMYATQFETQYASRAFPCFDDPSMKATFNATFAVPAGRNLIVLFNTPQTSNYTSGRQQIFTFGTTPHPMANYLVAFAVGNFDYVEEIDNGVPFRIYTPPGASKYGKFALGVSAKVTRFFGNLWNLPYSKMMPKMDQIAVPAIDEDAMENWGLLTYASSFLLVDETPGHYTLPQIQLIALVTTHEIAHQWFGDTITLPWWNQCYLNEGFARFLQFVGVDYLFPEWYIWTLGGDNSYYNFAYEPTMSEDMYGDAVPVITTLQQANGEAVADREYGCTGIAYGKGAAINRYISTYAGDTNWNQGLSAELNNHLWSNPNVTDLMQSLEKAGIVNASSKFLPWLVQPGFPVVRINVNKNTNVLTLTQTPISKYLPNKNSLWWIYLPIRGIASSGKTFSSAVEFQTASSQNVQLAQGDWLVEANYNFTAFIGIAYGDQWPAIIARVLSDSYPGPHVDRQLLLQSLYYLTVMSHEKLPYLLDFYDALSPILASYLTGTAAQQAEALYIYPIITNQILSIIQIAKTEPAVYNPLQQHLTAHLLADAARALGWKASPDEDPAISSLRSSIFFWAVYFNLNTADMPVVSQAIQLFYQHGTNLPDDIKSAVYLAVVVYNGTQGYDAILSAYQNAPKGSSDKTKLLLALSITPSVPRCHETIRQANSFNEQDRFDLAQQILTFNAECRRVAVIFYFSQCLALWRQDGSSATPAITSGMKQTMYTEEDHELARIELENHSQYVSQDTITSVLNRILINRDFIDFNS